MESWVLKGDSYSFLRSSPNNFNLQHLDGPNRVEIFDITCIPSHRSAISETTCLCDIFGDDCESPSLSSSPASSSFLKKDVDEQLPVEDVNDSSGSYHTANGSEHLSDASDTFEDSKDTKDAVCTPAIDLTLQNDKSEVTFVNDSPKSTGNWQVSCLSQETSLAQVENVSDHQLVASTSEFRGTNIRVTGSAHEIISSDLLSENKGIRDQSHATSPELGETDPTEDRVAPDLRRDAPISEPKEHHSTEMIITPDSSPENRYVTEQRHATTPELKETDSTQGNTRQKQGENTFSDSLNCLASEDDSCSDEEEGKTSLPYILPPENSSLVCETLISDPPVAQINDSNDDFNDFTPVQKTLFDPSTKDERHDLREHEHVPNKSAYGDTFFHDDTTSLSDLEDHNSVSPSISTEANIETDADPTLQHFNISSETREATLFHEHSTLSSFSDTREGLISSAMSELCSPSASSEDFSSSEPSIIIHSPVGFTVCHSPQPKDKIWSTGPEDLTFRPESPENGYRRTPIDKSSVSSFDSKLSPSPELRSIASTPENNQNILASSSGPRCSPEIDMMTCGSLTQHSKSPQVETKAPQNDFSSKNEVVQIHDKGIIHGEHFISTTLPIKEVTDITIPAISNIPPAQGGIFSPSPRDTMSPNLNGKGYTDSFTSDIIPTNETINMSISSNSPSTDRCTMSPHAVRSTESSDVLEQRSISMIPLTNDITNMGISPFSNISSLDGATSRSPSNLSIPRDTTSPDLLGIIPTRSSMLSKFPTENVETPAPSTEAGISRPPSNLSTPRDAPPHGVDGIKLMEIPASATILTNESTIKAVSTLSNDLPTASNKSIQRDSLPSDVKSTKDPQRFMSTKLPIKEIENMVITPITHLSSTELDQHISRSSSSTLNIPRNTLISPDVEEPRCEESSPLTISPTNEMRNMGISPTPNMSSIEEAMSTPSSTLSMPLNTTYPEIDGKRHVETTTANTAVINEMTDTANSPINLSGIIRPPSNLSVSRDVMCLDVEKTNYMEQSNEVPTKDLAGSPISNGSTGQISISGPPSSSSLPKTITSTDADGLRCVESPTPRILPTNEIPNMGVSPVFNVSSADDLSNAPSAFSKPRDMSFDGQEKRNTEKLNEPLANEIIIKANPSTSSLRSTDGGISRPSSFFNTSEDTNSTNVDAIQCTETPISTILPTNPAILPVYQLSSTGKGISRQPFHLNIPSDTSSPDIKGTKTISNLTRSLTVQPSSMMTYQRSNDHIPEAETCITLEYTDNERSATADLMAPLTVPADVGQIEDTGYKMSLKSCSLPQCDCTDVVLVPCIQPDKISGSLSEPPTPRLSVKQIKENWEKMNESILNSLNPWQTSKKTFPQQAAKEAKEGNDGKKELLERESASSAKTIGQMAMRPGESPSVLHSNNHSVYEGQSCRKKGWSGERVIQEEHMLGKGVGAISEGSYRGEQVELSFSTRNRKGPANRSPAPSRRDPKSGIPPRYFQSPLATRRQQSLPRAQNLQKENKFCARRVRSTSQSNYSGAGNLSSECTSETSSMGSEFDDADSEVKYFTDQAFKSLSSPQVDYLDVYNSSHGSSTNGSQPSTVESPGSATWICYADLHDAMREDDDVLCLTSFSPSGTLDPAKCFEMGSFECVDVAMENKGETRRGKRTVPKRQIQFKRRNGDELKSNENDENFMDSLSTQTVSADVFVRQHSTPASMQEDLVEGEHGFQTGKKMLQKSASLDESLPKSKMASNIIKSVISKKMDTATKESSRDEPCEDKKKHTEDITAGVSSNVNKQSSCLPECSLSSDNFVGKEERNPNPQKRSCRPKVPPKPVFKANCLPLKSNSAGLEFLDKTFEKDQIKPIMIDAFESKISKKQIVGNREQEASKLGEKCSSGSVSVMNRTPNCTAICVASTQRKSTTSDSKRAMTPETYEQQENSNSMFLSKTPEITLKPCTIRDKNKSSLKTSLCSHLEISKDATCEPMLEFEERSEEQMRFKPRVEPSTEDDNDQNKAKSVVHKVRDVRKLVKNTYNLSFKASNTAHKVEDVMFEKPKETQPENLHPLHIECKAISLKDKTVSCNNSIIHQDVAHTDDKSTMSQMDAPKRSDVGIAKITAKAPLQSIQHSDVDLFVGLDTGNNTSKSGSCEQSTKLEMPSRPSSKEISTLVFLQDSTPNSMQKPTSCASPDIKPVGHSLSMLLKEKGMQADIGVCDEGSGAKPKHINRLEIPLQTFPSEGSSNESQKLKNEDADLLPEEKASLNSSMQSSKSTLQVRSSPKPKEVRVFPSGKTGDNQRQGALLEPSEEQNITVAASSKADLRTFPSNTKIHAMPVTTSKEIELPIQVRSISSDRPKPSVLPKPSYKQPFSEIRSTSTDITPTRAILKEQADLKSDDKRVETSATAINNEQMNKSNNTKTLAVPAVSSHKMQAIPVTTMPSSVPKSTATTGRQEVYITSVQNSSNQQQQNIQEQVTAATSYVSNHQTLQAVSQASTYMQPTMTSSHNQLCTDDFHFRTSDDPPGYDERESFSPLQLSDLPPRRQTRYHPTTKHSLCSCTSCTHPQFGHGSQNQTPPVPRSPGQVISYPGAPPQAQVRPHQCRPDDQPSNYPSVSPKTTVQQAPTMIQPMHHSNPCSAPAIQRYGNEQKQPSTQLMDRRSGNQRSPQASSGATYREHNRSPNIAALDPRSQFFNPQELPPAFGHEYGSEGSGAGGVLYPENTSGLGFGQGPRRVLLDPETGKYFYIEVPMQPLRKMLFDPEIGQYVEVLIPQQTMSNSSMYPPAAAPYQGPYHGQGLYASHYVPYAMPPHPQSAQQPRHSESSVPTSLHQNTMGYGSTASQLPKSDVKGQPSLDQSYLESMYYIPTGMNASPNSTPSDCFHKPATNVPAAGGRRA